MATARPFAETLAQFLTVYLPVTRACSRHTVCAYRDAFTLFGGLPVRRSGWTGWRAGR